jgi:hypothetical protein
MRRNPALQAGRPRRGNAGGERKLLLSSGRPSRGPLRDERVEHVAGPLELAREGVCLSAERYGRGAGLFRGTPDRAASMNLCLASSSLGPVLRLGASPLAVRRGDPVGHCGPRWRARSAASCGACSHGDPTPCRSSRRAVAQLGITPGKRAAVLREVREEGLPSLLVGLVQGATMASGRDGGFSRPRRRSRPSAARARDRSDSAGSPTCNSARPFTTRTEAGSPPEPLLVRGDDSAIGARTARRRLAGRLRRVVGEHHLACEG